MMTELLQVYMKRIVMMICVLIVKFACDILGVMSDKIDGHLYAFSKKQSLQMLLVVLPTSQLLNS